MGLPASGQKKVAAKKIHLETMPVFVVTQYK
jgi:hypothetical protein